MSGPVTKQATLIAFTVVFSAFVGSSAYAQDAALPAVSDLVEAQKNKVVSIQTELAAPEVPEMLPFFGQMPMQPGPRVGQGSGFIVDPSGYVITNNHVVEGASVIKVGFENGDSYDAELVGSDPKIDIALLKIDANKPLPAVKLGSSRNLKVGEWVVAIGNPFGLDYSVTAGIVSALGRNIGAGPYDDFIQTDASINPGNSGGPLFNLRGEVVGVNTAIVRDGAGIGFAVPVDMVTDVLPQLRDNGYVVRGYIGTGIQDLDKDLAESFGLKKQEGVLIGSIADDGPAARAGLRPGDIVTEFDGKRVKTTQDLLLAVAATRPGVKARVAFIRDGKTLASTLTVAERPDSQRPRAVPVKNKPKEGNARLGVHVRPVDQRVARAMELRTTDGVVVEQVIPNTPAAKSLRPGDVILEVDGKTVNASKDIDRIVAKAKKGEVLRLLVNRAGNTSFVAVRL